MKTVVDGRLESEAERYAFRFRCDDCCHFDGARCGDDWPTPEHRLPLARGGVVVFCKQFEIA